MKLEPGAHVTANVRLVRPLGEGGMGAVWIAEHRALGTEVAVKFLSGDLLDNESVRSRFASEAAAASQVKSSHVVKIYDHGVTDTKIPFIVMELLDGEDLATRIRREGGLDPAVVATIVTQLCKALQAAHDKHVIHRDVKPDNIFLTNEGGELFVKLLDFGVAKNDRVTEVTLKRSTMAGEALGTPYYMSPEQFRSSKEIDHRTDLWSVGVVVYEAVTGQVPFDAENLTSLAIVVNEARAKPPSEVLPTLPKSLDAWFAKACARNPAERFQSARELADALRAGLSLEPSPRASLADADSSQRVVVQTALFDKGDISLRETAFASTGSLSQKPRRSRLAALLGVGGLAVVVTIAVVAMRSGPAPVAPPSAAPPMTTSASANVAPSAAPPPATTVAAAASAVDVESLPKPSPATTKPDAKKPAVTKPPPTAAETKAHDQIW